jgi:type III secretion system (T3SS) SseB-like protein
MSAQEEATAAESRLERLLAAAADDPVRRPAFAAALLDSQVYVLGHLQGQVVEGVAQRGASAMLLALADQDGAITPFFTSERMVQATLAAQPDTDPRFLRIGCRDLFEMTQGSRLVLNPHGPHGKVFVPDEVAVLLAGGQPGVVSETLPAGRQVMVGAPTHVPDGLTPVLARFFSQRPSVDAAYLGWIAHPDGLTGYFMVVVASDRHAALDGLGTLQITELTGGHALDVVVVPAGADNPLASSVEPFYVRSRSATSGSTPAGTA